MKYSARIESEQGKPRIVVGNEYLDIDIMEGNRSIAKLTVRPNENGIATVYNENDDDISTATGN